MADPCIAAMVQASGESLNEKQAEAILKQLRTKIERLVASGESLQSASRRVGAEQAGARRLAGLLQRKEAAENALKYQGVLNRVLVPGQEVRNIKALLTGVQGEGEGLALSIDADRHALHGQVAGRMMVALREAGVLKALTGRNKDFDRDIARELYRLEDPAAGEPTGNPAAQKTAEIIHSAQEEMRAMQNSSGAYIAKTEHYMTRQSHDMWKVRGAGTDADRLAWRAEIEPKLDPRTYDHLDDPGDAKARDTFLDHVWSNLASGQHEVSSSENMAGFSGPGNLAKRVSAERKLHFQNADAWFDYNAKYGQGSLLDAVQRGLLKGARDTALMKTLGTNPELMFGQVMKKAMADAVERKDFEAQGKLKSDWNEKILDTITGAANIPGGKGTLQKIGAIARGMQQLSKLGSVVISSLPDLAVNAAMLRSNGVGLMEGYARQLTHLIPGVDAGGKDVAESLGVGIDGLVGDVMHRFSAEDSRLGGLSKAIEVFHKFNGLTYWTDSLKRAGGLMLSNNLGRNAGREFAALDAGLQRNLTRYGIDAAGWDTMRATASVAGDGNVHLLPDNIRAAMPEDAAADALANKLQNYIIDQVRVGMTEPTAGGRTVITAGTKAGTAGGEMARMLMQFKLYTATYLERSVYRDVKMGDYLGLAQMVAGTTLLGYASMTIKDLIKGREPRKADSVTSGFKIGAAAMVQGGGMGIVGDFLFGEANRQGGGFVDTLMGPTAGTLNDISKLFTTYRDALVPGAAGEKVPGHPLAETINVLKNNAPFLNMFYTRAALDYAVLYGLQEYANPGYLNRYQQLIKKQNSQDFYLPPAQYAHRFGG